MNLLKRELAPLTDKAWEEIEDAAVRILRGNLSARKVVDFSGPHGLECSAVNLGRLKSGLATPVNGVECGVRQVQPLTEVRIPFSLDIWELDNIERGSADPDLGAVEDAASKAALFEEKAVYHGYDAGCIRGVVDASPHKKASLSASSASAMTASVEDAIVAIEKCGIGGPYALVLGTEAYRMLMAGDDKGYPLHKRVEDLVGGGVYWTPAVDSALVLSRRGGDFELTVGQDLSIGFHNSTTKRVDLYITESFTFRILEPAACLPLAWKK